MIYDGALNTNEVALEIRTKPSVRYFVKDSQGRFRLRVKGFMIYFGRTVYQESELSHTFETIFSVRHGFVEHECQVNDIFIPGDAVTFYNLEGKYLAKYIRITDVVNCKIEDNMTKISFSYEDLFTKVENAILEVRKWDAESASHTKVYVTGRLTRC